MENFISYLEKYNSSIEKIFSKNLKKTLNILYKISKENNVKIFLVGGIVRDIFLGRNSSDVDIVMQGDCREFANLVLPYFKVSKHKFTEKFFTYNIYMHNGINIDIASFREETYKHPGALPDVYPSSIENDYLRRDFTINSMYISFDEKTEFFDPLNALQDIKDKIIKIIHNKSFEDDPTRILRALKFASRYNFSFDENTEHLLNEAVKNNFLSAISIQRLKNEIYMLFSERNLINILKLFREYGIFKYLNIGDPSDEDIFFINKSVNSFLFRKIKSEFPISRGPFIFMLLMKNKSYNEKLEFLKYFEFSEKNIENILLKENEAEEITEKIIQAEKNSEIHNILKHLTPFKLLYLFFTARRGRNKLKSYIFDLNGKNAIITGRDLISVGLKEGLNFSEYLKRCLEIQLDMENPGREKILEKFMEELKADGKLQS